MENRNLRKERIGVVTSNKMEKSIVVAEVKRVKHPMYGKFVLKTKKYVAQEHLNSKGFALNCTIGESKHEVRGRAAREIAIIDRIGRS